MKNILVFLASFGFYINCFSQIKTTDKSECERVVVEFGQIIPLGNLKTKFDNSIYTAFWYRTQLSNGKFIDLGGCIYFPKNRKSINYEHNDSIYKQKLAKVSGQVSARYSRVYELSKNFNFEWNSTFGLAILGHESIDKEEYSKINQRNIKTKEDGNYEQALLAIAIGQGFKLSRKNFGINCQYQYVPYSLFYKSIDPNFGSSALTIGFVYKQ